MDPLDKRYNDSLEPQRQPQQDGGDLDAGGDPSERRPWHEGGLAADVDRSLQRVQLQEAWLQGQQRTTLLDASGSAGLALGSNRFSDATGAAGQHLLVVDTSRPDWQRQVEQNQRSANADLLLLEPGDQGLERIQSALQQHTYSRITLLPGSDGNGTRSLGAEQFNTAELPEELRHRIATCFRAAAGAELHVLAGEIPTGLQRALTAASQLPLVEQAPSEAITTSVLNEAPELLRQGRELLQRAEQSGLLQRAIEAAFSAANQGAVLAAAMGLLKGEQAPQLQWARFQQGSIRGAFLQERNTVLISHQLQNGGAELEAVLLEELGHWLETTAPDDSSGDEGERFSAALREQSLGVEVGRDRAKLLIDGSVVQAELAQIVSDSQQQGLLNDARTAITLSFDEALTNPSSVGMARFSFSNASGTALANFPAISSFSIASNQLTINLVSPVDTSTLTNGLKVNYSGEPSMGGTALTGSNNSPVGTFSAFVSFTSSG
ncbi:MAG: hypothetical protein FJ060_10720, partial [Cyanobacteria bacterium K_Offshore_0m_m2_072]|nr:hypothetical protein [Cyanobacteria bacterium K_Offshore_0m_m2_072]